jgi:quercetin dioxygenase-like cupin family protein
LPPDDGVIYRDMSELARNPRWLPLNTGWGSFRATHGPIRGQRVRAGLVRMPPAQRSPWHGSGGWPELGQPFPPVGWGCFFVCISGEVDFYAGGREFQLRENDVLKINAVVYSYANPGESDVWFWTVHPLDNPPDAEAKGETWEGDPSASGTLGSHPYYDEEPSHRPGVLDRISLVSWDNYRRLQIAWQGQWGALGGYYPEVSVGLHGRMLRIPAAQAFEIQPKTETLFLGTGSSPAELKTDFRVRSIELGAAAIVPAGLRVTLANPHGTDSLIYEIRARAQ